LGKGIRDNLVVEEEVLEEIESERKRNECEGEEE